MIFDSKKNLVTSSHETERLSQCADELWERIEPLLAPFKRKRSGCSKPLLQCTVLAGILYKCRSGCQWAMLPACCGSKSTVRDHFQRGNKAGVMAEIFRILLAEYGEKAGVNAQWQAMDGTLRKPRRALKKSVVEGLGRNSTDRGRSGGKIHLHVDGQGIPLGVTVTGANVHDSRLMRRGGSGAGL